MKKLAVLIVCAAVMASCDGLSGGSKDQLKAENDSLLMELTQRTAELDERHEDESNEDKSTVNIKFLRGGVKM